MLRAAHVDVDGRGVTAHELGRGEELVLHPLQLLGRAVAQLLRQRAVAGGW